MLKIVISLQLSFIFSKTIILREKNARGTNHPGIQAEVHLPTFPWSKPAVNRQPGDRRGTDEAAFSFSNTNFYSIKFFKKNMSSKYLNIWKFILYFIKIMFYSLIMLQTTKNNITWWNYVPKSIYFWQTRVRKKNLKTVRCKNVSRALIEALSQLFLHLRPDLSRKFLFLLSKNPDLP